MLLIWTAMTATLILTAPPTMAGLLPADADIARLVARTGLRLPETMRPAVARRATLRGRGMLVGGFTGLAVGVAIAASAAWSGNGGLEGVIVLAAAGLGRAAGSFLGARADGRVLDENVPRVARVRETTVVDYSSRGEVIAVDLSLVGVLTSGLGALGVWYLVPVRPAGGWSVPVVVAGLTVLALVALGGMRRAARGVVARPQPAQDNLELAWSDVLRSEAVRDLQDTGIVTGLLTMLGLLATAGTWVIPAGVRSHGMHLTENLGFTAAGIGVLCWAAVLIPWSAGRQVRNPSRKMWQQPTTSPAAR